MHDPKVDLPDATNVAGLTKQAGKVRRDLERAFGPLSLGGFSPKGVSSGHMSGSAHYEGRAIDAFVRPINQDNQRRGWAIAAYAVAHADALDIQHVIFDGKIWTAGSRSEQGWRDFTHPGVGGRPSGADAPRPRPHRRLELSGA